VVGRPDSATPDASTRASYLNDRADLYRHLGRLDDAEKDGLRSIELDPKQVDAYVALALVESRRGRPEAARAWYDRMVAANPASAEARLLRAGHLRDLGRWDQAAAEIDAAEKLDAGRGPGLVGLARAGLLAARGDHSAAAALAEASLKKAPEGDGDALYAAACAFSLASRAAASAGEGSRATALADRAAALLSEALSRGFHDRNYQEQGRMGEDPALRPIWDRDDVRRLISARP
jgi:tetratricopeptide (TPR) repeat protein